MSTWIDGVSGTTVPADDRGLLYGDGLFETVCCRGGNPRFLTLHLQRLARGCTALGFPPPDLELLATELRHAAAVGAGAAQAGQESRSDGLLRLTLTRGSAAVRGYAPPVQSQPRRILSWHPLAEGPGVVAPIEACHSRIAAGVSPALAGFKHLNRLENVLARAELVGTGCEEAVLSTAHGELVGGTMSNLFAVCDGALLTPPIRSAGVRGVMREVVLREAAAAGIPARESVLRRQDLDTATEIFFTNVRVGLWPVATLGLWQATGSGPLVARLQRLIHPLQD